MADWVVDNQTPDRYEYAVGLETDPLCEGAGDQGGSDDGKLALEHRKNIFGHVGGHDLFVDAAEAQQAVVPADPAAQSVLAKGHRIAADHPQHGDDRHGDEAVHHCSEDVLGPNQAPIKEGQTRDHQKDQGRRGQHPGGDTVIDRNGGTVGGQRTGNQHQQAQRAYGD